MPSKTLAELSAEINAAVPAQSGLFKTSGPALNGVLQSLAAELRGSAPAGTTYKASLMFAYGDDLVGPDFHAAAAVLTRAELSPAATGLRISLDGGTTYAPLLPLLAGTWEGALAIPQRASVFYQVMFAPDASSAGAVLTLQETV